MKKKVIIIGVIVIFLLTLIPTHRIYSDLPITTYESLWYKYISYNKDSIYNFPYKNKLILFPMNFKKTRKYYEEEIEEVHICNQDNCVETILGNYLWNKKTNDAIFPVARNYKETLPVKNNEELIFSYNTNVEIESIDVYDAISTNSIKGKANFTKKTITFHDLNVGEYIISIHTVFKNNKVEYSFKIKIEE